MASYKFLLSVVFLAGVATASFIEIPKTPRETPQHINCLNLDPTWETLVTIPVDMPGKLLQVIRHEEYYQVSDPAVVIKCVKVVDLMQNGRNGYPVITQGGIGKTFVEIQFTSQRSRGLNFRVAILGTKGGDGGSGKGNDKKINLVLPSLK